MNIKNIAIIAHVDHGKTTLVDEMLKTSGLFRDNQNVKERMMDSNALEKERGITILAKNTAIEFNDHHINIMDTPGHADFSGEVERIMTMVDGVLLVVDALEGCMPQTRFVLNKAMEYKKKIIVVINKIDKPATRVEEVIDEVLDLFIDLGADESQIDFPIVYASALQGQSGISIDSIEDSMEPLLNSIIENIDNANVDNDEEFTFQVSLLDYNDYVGRIGIGRVYSGELKANSMVKLFRNDGTVVQFRATKLYGFKGLERVEIEKATAGQIIAIVGKDDINVGETVGSLDAKSPLPKLRVDEPTLEMEFIVNDSPFAGLDGKFVTARKIEERLSLETKTDVSLRVERTDSPNKFTVCGRGELHLSILVENLRREGFELMVSKPRVIVKTIDGVKHEPVEEVVIDVPEEYVGTVMETMGLRKAQLIDMKVINMSTNRLIFHVYSRALIGYMSDFITITKGYGILNHTFLQFEPVFNGTFSFRNNGVLVSMETGKVTAYGLVQLEDRGTMFVSPGDEVYEGMIVGENNKNNDLAVNVVRMKQKTNVRSANKDTTVSIKKARVLSLEQYIQYLDDDEYLEVTPSYLRLRKKTLDKSMREKERKFTLREE